MFASGIPHISMLNDIAAQRFGLTRDQEVINNMVGNGRNADFCRLLKLRVVQEVSDYNI